MQLSVELVVLNRLGLHARPAAEFVRCAQRFGSTTLVLRKGGEVFAATSILEVLVANLDEGCAFTLEADGPDAADAVRELSALLEQFRAEEAVETPAEGS